MAKDFIAAITIGTSQIVGIVGQKETDGIKVLACATEPTNGFVKRGIIINIDKIANIISNIKYSLNEQIKDLGSISKMYVGIGGQSIRTSKNNICKYFSYNQKIDKSIVNNMLKESKNVTYANAEVFKVIAQEYNVGSEMTTDPVGTEGNFIKCEYINIIANPRLRERVKSCFNESGTKIEEIRLTPIVLADALLKEDEKRSGCVFIDFGAETTTVSIYRNNILRHMAVIPLGSNAINKDLNSVKQIDNEYAEDFKIQHATAVNDEENANDCEVQMNDKEYTLSELQSVVEARVKEILLNINHQIELSGYSMSKLLGGIIITGRAAMLKKLETAIQINISNVKIRNAQNITFNVSSSSEEFNNNFTNMLIPALCLVADEHTTANCNAPVAQKATSTEIEFQTTTEEPKKAAGDIKGSNPYVGQQKPEPFVPAEPKKPEPAQQPVEEPEIIIKTQEPEKPVEQAVTEEKPAEQHVKETKPADNKAEAEQKTADTEGKKKERTKENPFKKKENPFKKFLGVVEDLVTDEVSDDDNKK